MILCLFTGISRIPYAYAGWAPDFIEPEVFGPRREDKLTWIAEIIAGFVDLEPDGHVDMLYVHAAHLQAALDGIFLRKKRKTSTNS